VRGLIRAGISQKTTLSITGHKAISVLSAVPDRFARRQARSDMYLERSPEQECERLESQAIPFWQDSGIAAQETNRNRCSR